LLLTGDKSLVSLWGMSNDKDSLSERGRSLEADYFRRRDQELLEQARQAQALAERRRQLAAALGSDDATVTALGEAGFDEATLPLLEVVPAIQVAWADGSLPAGERAQIERILARPEMKEAARLGSTLAAGWLARQPGPELYRLAIDALQHRLARLDPPTRTQMVRRIIADCNAVAGASGGVFGVGTHSSVESARIRELAAALGVEP
jgi:hypothetical protein